MRLLIVALALLLSSCEGGLFTPACRDIGVYPFSCRRSGSVVICDTGRFICHDLTQRDTCRDNGGVLCLAQ
jgi:hypothetical protein